MAAVSALIVFGLYQVSDLQMDFGNRFRWPLVFPVALVLLSRPWGALDGAAGAKSAGTGSAETGSAGTGLARRGRRVGVSGDGATVSATTPSARWSALALLICTVTAIGGAAAYQASGGYALIAAVVAGVAAAAGST